MKNVLDVNKLFIVLLSTTASIYTSTMSYFLECGSVVIRRLDFDAFFNFYRKIGKKWNLNKNLFYLHHASVMINVLLSIFYFRYFTSFIIRDLE